MKTILVFIILSLFLVNLFNFVARGEDDCVAGKPEASYSKKSEGLRDYKFIKSKEDNVITESFKLSDLIEVKISQGGCAHFNKSVTFIVHKTKQKFQKLNAKFWLTRTKILLQKLPKPNLLVQALQSELTSHEKELLMQKSSDDDRVFILESTDKDGYNTISLEVLKNVESTEITVSVNTAL